MLSMRIQLFTSVNNSECMKQHCTPPLRCAEPKICYKPVTRHHSWSDFDIYILTLLCNQNENYYCWSSMIMSNYFNVFAPKNDKDLCWYRPKAHFWRAVYMHSSSMSMSVDVSLSTCVADLFSQDQTHHHYQVYYHGKLSERCHDRNDCFQTG